ncbi:class I adenylate-forming enzyme family protein [Mycobacterium spongiae]|uniref:AMP-binding protein n=1 Tax=Mycobacterium spongiae TaxID=886343 RepID=A0A975JZW6_9MYCO|nr:class I adenylate-forming enzyme family protein [Mycobacterium spongiae]QUR68767.1 AMP-binding protein [Mycobacterium spongiae]
MSVRIMSPTLGKLTEVPAALGDRIALVDQGRRWSYRELRTAADELAAAMRMDGLVGERVALMLPNCVDLVTAYLASFTAGAIAVPLNARYAPPEVEQVLRRARPRWLVVHTDRLGTLARLDQALLDGTRVIVVGESGSSDVGRDNAYDAVLRSGRGKSASSSDVLADAAAVIFFTSGSTGRPKGVVHSHSSALAMLTSTSEAFGDAQPDDVVQVFEPLVHVSGFIATFTILLAGGTVALYEGFDAAAYAHALTLHRPTLICTHVDILAQLLQLPGVCRDWFSSLRGVYTGGDVVPHAVQREFLQVSGLPIRVGYGMTEAIWLTVQREARTDRDGCIGRPLRTVRLRIDESTGELLVAGPMVMQRYWDDETHTSETLVDGWLHTGDLAQHDEQGVWWFTGRIKDVIVRRTSKITPGEVETALGQHPGVMMAAVVGAPDPAEGEVPVAFVVPRPDADLSPAELTKFLHGLIAAYKVPARIHLRRTLPLTASGKISRNDLIESDHA